MAISTRKAYLIRRGVRIGQALLKSEPDPLLAVQYVQAQYPLASNPTLHIAALRTITKALA